MMRKMPVKDATLLTFGRNIARIRDAKGLSQDKLAEKANLDRTYLSGIERGVRNPGIKRAMLLRSKKLRGILLVSF
jgi:transcriptional regulator with XRE-family HTH domain